jgi:hypothetical protein
MLIFRIYVVISIFASRFLVTSALVLDVEPHHQKLNKKLQPHGFAEKCRKLVQCGSGLHSKALKCCHFITKLLQPLFFL